MKTLLYETQEKLGAEFFEFQGWTIAKKFGEPRSKGVIDLTFTGVIQIDDGEFLNTQTTQDVSNLKNGSSVRTAFTDKFGKVIGLSIIYKIDNSFLLWCYPGCFQKLFFHLLPLSKLSKAKVTDPRLGVIGILSEDEQEPGTIKKDGDNFIAKHSTMPLQLIFTKEPRKTYESLLNKLQPVGWDDFNKERIKNVEFIYGLDIDDTYVFPEYSLSSHVSFSKGCYLGQEVVSRLHTYNGTPPKIPIKMKSNLKVGEKVIIDNQEAGHVTSSSDGYVIATIKKQFLDKIN